MADAPNPSVRAIARHVRISPQKARLVVDLIRGMNAGQALHRLRFTNKRIAADVAKLLTSAIANATENAGLDPDSLVVVRAFVNDGPRQKRIRPAPMGRAYRYQRRTSHIEIHVGEKPGADSLVRRAQPAAAAPAAKPAAGAKRPAAKKPAARKPAAKKPAASKSPAAKQAAAPKKPKASTPQKRGGK